MAKKKKTVKKVETQEVKVERLQELPVFYFPPINGGKTVPIRAKTKKEAVEIYKNNLKKNG